MAFPTTISPDGSRIVFDEGVAGQPRDLRTIVLPPSADGRQAGGAVRAQPPQLSSSGSATRLLDTRFAARMYDVAADGQRFLVVKLGSDGNGPPPQIVVVQNSSRN